MIVAKVAEEVELDCPWCTVKIELSSEDMKKKFFRCPFCNGQIEAKIAGWGDLVLAKVKK